LEVVEALRGRFGGMDRAQLVATAPLPSGPIWRTFRTTCSWLHRRRPWADWRYTRRIGRRLQMFGQRAGLTALDIARPRGI